MKYDLHLYHIDMKYIRELHKADDNVMSISPQINKNTRPFFGIVILLNGRKYCIPLTSPKKEKFKGKSQVDFIKIKDSSRKDENGAEKTIGILNINNMIPVCDQVLKKIDLKQAVNDPRDVLNRKGLMIDQLRWCRKNYQIIENRANKVYKLVTETPEKNKNLVRRCCDFKKLEKVLDSYIANHL